MERPPSPRHAAKNCKKTAHLVLLNTEICLNCHRGIRKHTRSIDNTDRSQEAKKILVYNVVLIIPQMMPMSSWPKRQEERERKRERSASLLRESDRSFVVRHMIKTSMTICKLVIAYSVLSLTCWCNADIQDVTTLMTSNEETDSDISATALDDYNATTAAPTPPMTTINEYYSLSSTLPRDRMGTANSHYHSHKDRPKSEEVSLFFQSN